MRTYLFIKNSPFNSYGLKGALFLSFLLLQLGVELQAQPIILQQNQFFLQDAAHQASSIESNYHSAIRPFVQGVNYNQKQLDSTQIENYQIHLKKNIWARKLKQESLLLVDSPNFKLSLDPLFNFEMGQDSKMGNKRYYNNTRGVLIRGSIGNDFAFESTFLENQAEFVDYLNSYVKDWEVVPGQGRVKAFKKTGYDYANATGVLSYSPNAHFNIMAGSGKLFVGNGYRSLLLSDNAFNYPYAKVNYHNKKFSYTAAWASMQVVKNGRYVFNILSEPIYTKKAFTFQYVSYKPIQRLEIGLYQAVMWKAQGPNNRQFDYNILNPLIFSHAVQYNLSDNNNVMLGANINFKVTNDILVYGQFMADDITKKETGLQGGLKYFNVAGVRNLYAQVEYNKVSAYSYSYPKAFQSFSHYNQPIASQLGANYSELVAITNYRWHDFFVSAKLNFIQFGKDSTKMYAGNTVIMDYLNTNRLDNTMQLKTTTQFIDLKIGYVVNRASNLCVSVGAMLRNSSNVKETLQTNYVYFSVGTAITNKYYDF